MEQVQISYHGLEASPALNEVIATHARRLAELNDRLGVLRVAVEAPNHRHRHGQQYRVHLELALPGDDLVIDRNDHADGDDVYVSVRRAFDVLRRRLCAVEERRRGRQRAHVAARASIRH
jgi:ribosome-associated translation inhibitor RaiA